MDCGKVVPSVDLKVLDSAGPLVVSWVAVLVDWWVAVWGALMVEQWVDELAA